MMAFSHQIYFSFLILMGLKGAQISIECFLFLKSYDIPYKVYIFTFFLNKTLDTSKK
jgi:hypothetical protein